MNFPARCQCGQLCCPAPYNRFSRRPSQKLVCSNSVGIKGLKMECDGTPATGKKNCTIDSGCTPAAPLASTKLTVFARPSAFFVWFLWRLNEKKKRLSKLNEENEKSFPQSFCTLRHALHPMMSPRPQLVFATGSLIIGIIVGIERILHRAPVLRLCSKLGFARFSLSGLSLGGCKL